MPYFRLPCYRPLSLHLIRNSLDLLAGRTDALTGAIEPISGREDGPPKLT